MQLNQYLVLETIIIVLRSSRIVKHTSLKKNRWCFICSVSTAASSRAAAGITATESLMNSFGRDHLTCSPCFCWSIGRRENCENVVLIYQIKYSVTADILCFQCLLWSVPFRELRNASVSVLGDCFSMAVIQQLPKKDLDKMDEQCKEDSEDTENGVCQAQWI